MQMPVATASNMSIATQLVEEQGTISTVLIGVAVPGACAALQLEGRMGSLLPLDRGSRAAGGEVGGADAR